MAGFIFVFALGWERRRRQREKGNELLKGVEFHGNSDQKERLLLVVDEYMLEKIHDLNAFFYDKTITQEEYSLAIEKFIKYGGRLKDHL